MAELIPCDGVNNPTRLFKERRGTRWFFLWLSYDDRQELQDLLLDLEELNAYDLGTRYNQAECEPEVPLVELGAGDDIDIEKCRKGRDPLVRKEQSSISVQRPFYVLGLAVRAVVYIKNYLDVWCEPPH